jgi:glycosyltransferase involved in cell wall biosynthesis
MLLPSLRKIVEQRKLSDRVLLLGSVPQAELHEWTSSSDLGVLILEPINLSKRLALANKIFEYMGAEVPILTTDLPENRRIVDGCDCGWLITDWTPRHLGERIAALLSQPEQMQLKGKNGRRCVEHRYNWEIESERVLETIRPLVSAGGRSDD